VLFKGGEALERLAHLDVIVLDKTGTLTVGRPVLEAVHLLPPAPLALKGHGFNRAISPPDSDAALAAEGIQISENASIQGLKPNFPFGLSGGAVKTAPFQSAEVPDHERISAARLGRAEDDLLRLAAAAEERSNHPLAHAIVDEAKLRGLSWPSAEEVQILPGRGLTAKIEGRDCLLGNEVLFQEFFIPLPAGIAPPEPGVTRLWMALDRVAAGFFDARDALRPDAAGAVAALRAAGLQVLMLTGDSSAAAAPIARQAGIAGTGDTPSPLEWEAGLDPAGKLARIRTLQQSGLRVAMVGDGINDAAALAQADAGIAMGTGADLAQEAGDVLILRAQPAAIPAAIDLARSTLRVMRQNLVWAAGYNLLGIPLAAGALYPHFHILLSPWLAAAAMALSSVSVLANSLRLRGWAPAMRQTLGTCGAADARLRSQN
jgi:cation transport ATPase